jgi:hypothetical protein
VIHVLKLVTIPDGPQHNQSFVKLIETPVHSEITNTEECEANYNWNSLHKLLQDWSKHNLGCCWQDVEVIIKLKVHGQTEPYQEGAKTEDSITGRVGFKVVNVGKQLGNGAEDMEAISCHNDESPRINNL